MSKIGIFLLVFFVLELALLVSIGGAIGVVATILWFIASAFIGISLLKGNISRIREKFIHGVRNPRNVLFQEASVALVFAAIFLIVPGFFSVALGLAILLVVVFAKGLQKGFSRGHETRTTKSTRREMPLEENPSEAQNEIASFEIIPEDEENKKTKP